jgi:hypothetical protein
LTNAIFKGRRAVHLENDFLRVTVLEEGGHIAEVFDKRAGVSPLWLPPWTSLEPSDFSPGKHSNFGTGADGRLLAGIMGHNLCLDLFGGPSPEEAAAGFAVHGEASVDRYDITESSGQLRSAPDASHGPTQVRAVVQLHGQYVRIREVGRISARWTVPLPGRSTSRWALLSIPRQHSSALYDRSVVSASGYRLQRLPHSGKEFYMANRPRQETGSRTLRQMHKTAPRQRLYAPIWLTRSATVRTSSRARHNSGWPSATSGSADFLAGHREKTAAGFPWDGKTVTRGMEFGVRLPETRRGRWWIATGYWMPCVSDRVRGRLTLSTGSAVSYGWDPGIAHLA